MPKQHNDDASRPAYNVTRIYGETVHVSTPITIEQRASEEKIRSDSDETLTSRAGGGLGKKVENMSSDKGGV